MASQIHKIAAGILSGVLLTAASTEIAAAQRYSVGVCQVAQKDLREDLYPIATAHDYIVPDRKVHVLKLVATLPSL